jgi:hypothetical protein
MGPREVHASHTPLYVEALNLWICHGCGYYAACQARHLARPCRGCRTAAGARHWARVLRKPALWPHHGSQPRSRGTVRELHYDDVPTIVLVGGPTWGPGAVGAAPDALKAP